MATTDYEAIARQAIDLQSSAEHSTHFGAQILRDLKIVRAEKGRVDFELKVSESLLNPFGTLHGAVLALLADACTTINLLTSGMHPGVSVSLNVDYLSTAKLGHDLLITTHTLKAGGKLAFTEASILNKTTNQMVAKASHTKFVASPKL
ncbi:HotDog domain-containing protein [Phlyctochytrium arcticum]|nr:HotDog domain-containing protein [Phlyctochytrium arcticum]